MLGVKMSQVQILLILYLLIAEDVISAPLLFKNPASAEKTLCLTQAVFSGG